MLYIHAALAAEARPLLDHYRLRACCTDAPFRLYANDALRLVVSGPGKTATAAAIAYTCARFADELGPWLNVGIAGHPTAALGTPLWVHRATDTANDATYYPGIAFTLPCLGAPLETVDKPGGAYSDGTLCDMEGSAFFQTTQRFVAAELAHSLKVVSDNRILPSDAMDRQRVGPWVAGLIPLIDRLRPSLEEAASRWHIQRYSPAYFDQALARSRFSSAQQHRLRLLLQQWETLAPGQPPWDEDSADLSARQFLDALEGRLGNERLLPY